MKIKNLAYAAVICTLIIGIVILGFHEMHAMSEAPRHGSQNQLAPPDRHPFISISKGTILVLLAVGVIGALSIRRKKKAPKSPAQHTASEALSGDRNKAFIDLNKQYLNLQYKITQHKFSGDTPPDGLLEEISDIERKVHLIARALE